ncbi:hypothetical protein [Tatumella sp. UBA2305]|uniref:hypothetical protein n=1 Tax=Tatumella sp. UBA2305 TaxID=1947647 RepID=UPI0025E825F1|nr:hypothetical protein [Tatumella sp. UBA2305]
MTRLAVISDIHNNIVSLDAMLKDIAAQSADLMINHDDIVSGCLCPAETAYRSMPPDFPTIKDHHLRK